MNILIGTAGFRCAGEQSECTVPELEVQIGNSGGDVQEKQEPPKEYLLPGLNPNPRQLHLHLEVSLKSQP